MIELGYGLTSYALKYALFVVTVYFVAGYINVPAVQSFIKDLAATFASNLGHAGADVTATVVTETAKGVAGFAAQNPSISASVAGIMSILNWGPTAVASAGVASIIWMKKHIIRW